MISLLNLGVSDPLTFGMAHPLTDRLERLTSVNVSKTKARMATGLLLLTAVSISAPFTIATEKLEKVDLVSVKLVYPQATPKLSAEDFLEIETPYTSNIIDISSHADNLSNHTVTINRSDEKQTKAKFNVHAKKDEGRQSYDVEVQGNTLQAYRLNSDGSRQAILVDSIDGFDPEAAKKAGSWSFSVGHDNQLLFLAGESHSLPDYSHSKSARLIQTHQSSELVNSEGESFVLNKYDLGYLYTMTHKNALTELAILQGQRRLTSNEVAEIKRALKDITLARGGALIAEAPQPPYPPVPPPVSLYPISKPPMPPAKPAFIGKGMQFANGKLIASDGPYTVIRDGEAKTMFEGRELTDSRSRILAAEAVLDSVESLLDHLEDYQDMNEDRHDAFEDMSEARRDALEAKIDAEVEAQEEAREAAMEAREEIIEAQEEQRQEALERRQEMQERVQEKIEKARERIIAKTKD